MLELDAILSKHNLRKTNFRRELLGMFYEANSSLSVEEIRNKVGTTNDKVTVYRALEAFQKKGLIHKVPDKNNLTRYALCHSKCTTNKHTHNHAHFICDSCNKTFCIDDIKIPEIKNAKGFNIKKSKLTLEGYCPSCEK